VRAIDPRTVEVTLERPTPFFLFLTSFATLSPAPRHVVEKWGDKWTRPEHIVVNGPYKPVRWALQDEIELAKNPLYWDAAHVPVQTIHALSNDNDHSEMNLYRTGGVDTTSPNNVPPLSAVPSLRHFKDYSEHPFLATYWYEFNCRRKPFDDVRVRRALAKAIDKQKITQTILYNLNQPALSLVPDLFGDTTGYRPPVNESDRFDPREARKLLADAGFPAGKGFPSVSMFFNAGDQHRLIAEAVQAMWHEVLGIDVKILNVEWKVMRAECQQGNFDIARSGWQADYPEPSTFLTVYLSDGGQNDSGWKSVDFDTALNAALAEPDLATRNALYAKAERILLDEAPMIPMYVYSKSMLAAPELEGLEDNPMDLHLYKHLRWR
jgi:oligopeptide transport system substrate-binding protein